LPTTLNNKYNCIVEVGKINNDNIFNAIYLMEYKDLNNCIKNLQYINNTFEFNIFLQTLQFNNDSFITLNDEDDKSIGKIYKLEIKINNSNLQNNLKIQSNNINYNDKIKLNKEINELKEKIYNLEKELKEEKYKNEILEQKLFKLKSELDESMKNNKDIKDYQEINNALKESLYKTNEEIKLLRTKLSRFPFELNEGEKLMSVIFTTYDENLYYSIICKNTERFSIIENKLYEAYSEYSNPENNFIFNGKKINKVKTLEENGIKNNSIIILNS